MQKERIDARLTFYQHLIRRSKALSHLLCEGRERTIIHRRQPRGHDACVGRAEIVYPSPQRRDTDASARGDRNHGDAERLGEAVGIKGNIVCFQRVDHVRHQQDGTPGSLGRARHLQRKGETLRETGGVNDAEHGGELITRKQPLEVVDRNLFLA